MRRLRQRSGEHAYYINAGFPCHDYGDYSGGYNEYDQHSGYYQDGWSHDVGRGRAYRWYSSGYPSAPEGGGVSFGTYGEGESFEYPPQPQRALSTRSSNSNNCYTSSMNSPSRDSTPLDRKKGRAHAALFLFSRHVSFLASLIATMHGTFGAAKQASLYFCRMGGVGDACNF